MALPVLAACGPGTSASEKDGGRIQVVATTTQVADFARNVGGKRVQVTQLLKPNVDPHDFEAAPADIQAISAADLIVKNGLGLEAWLDDTIEAAGFDGTTVDTSNGVAVREAAEEEEEEHGEEHGHGEDDPHIWHNPANAKIMARNIANGLAEVDAEHEKDYRANLKKYSAELDELDADIKKQIASIPKEQRKLVTNHDAFGYYLDHYGIRFVGSIIPSQDSSAELSGKRLDDLVDKIKAEQVPAVFSESSLSPKTARTIGDRAGVKVVAGEDSLYGDTLGPRSSDGGTYIAMMEHNTETIVGGLGG
ncbi:MAG: zinc ABC transporter substrate-binding protein [Streptosporangiales bacterium]|nr:zinc ABC transporter substrate-binding protein [Streptosporangiales bacterium]